MQRWTPHRGVCANSHAGQQVQALIALHVVQLEPFSPAHSGLCPNYETTGLAASNSWTPDGQKTVRSIQHVYSTAYAVWK